MMFRRRSRPLHHRARPRRWARAIRPPLRIPGWGRPDGVPDDVRAGSQPTDERPRPVEPPQAPPPGVAPIPATAVTDGQPPSTQAVSYVEHLGPDLFPGRLRGLYGGSLWLEPSFNGLQWPYLGHTGLGVSGAVWLDTGYETIHRNQQQIANSKMYFQQGRGVLRLTPTYAHDTFFVQGQLELVANVCQAANAVCTNQGTYTTDDSWIRVGQWNRWDLKVGRFEAWEVYHLGMGADQFTLERLGAGNFGVDTFTNPPLEAPSFYGREPSGTTGPTRDSPSDTQLYTSIRRTIFGASFSPSSAPTTISQTIRRAPPQRPTTAADPPSSSTLVG